MSDADKAMYQGQVTEPLSQPWQQRRADLDHAAQTMALTEAVTALQAIDLSDLSTQAKIDAAQELPSTALRSALDCGDRAECCREDRSHDRAGDGQSDGDGGAGQRRQGEGQKMVLSECSLRDLRATSTLTDSDDAGADRRRREAAIIALDLALAAATDLTDAEKLDATVDVTVAKRKVKGCAGNARRECRRAAHGADRGRGPPLAMIDLDDLSDQAKITAAQTAVDALKAALDAATHLSDADEGHVPDPTGRTATETVRMAQTGMDRDGRMTAQRTAIMTAVTAARTAVGMVDDEATDAEVTAADTCDCRAQGGD